MLEQVKNTIDRYSPNPVLYHFVLSQPEIDLFLKIISDSRVYLEFGAGGSTIFVLKNSRAKVYSVESSISWIDHLRRYLFVRFKEFSGKLQFYHANIGPTGYWACRLKLIATSVVDVDKLFEAEIPWD